jgi:hypothetical protein
MSIKPIFIGSDLSKMDGDDVVSGGLKRYDVINSVKKLVVNSSIIDTPTSQYLIDTRDNGGNSYLYINTSGRYILSGCSATVDGVVISNGTYVAYKDNGVDIVVTFNTTQPIKTLLANDGNATADLWDGYWSSIKMYDGSDVELYNESTDGKFGNDTIGDGELKSYNWRKLVDGVSVDMFATSALYKSQWVLPMEQSQAVVFEEPSDLLASNSYWNPYNQDGTYTFTVDTNTKSNVFIGNLANADGNDIVRGGLKRTTTINNVKKLVVTSTIKTDTSWQYLVDARDNSGTAICAIDDIEQYYLRDCRLYVNGVEVYHEGAVVEFSVSTELELVFDTPQPLKSIMSSNPDANLENWIGYWSSVKMYDSSESELYNENTNGKFGDNTVGDGELVDYTWKKDKYQQSFATKELYKAQWTIPMEESQNVVFELADDYVASDDAYWNPYNQSATYAFLVSKLGGGFADSYINMMKLNLSLSL